MRFFVCLETEVTKEQFKKVFVDGVAILLVRDSHDVLYAFPNLCTHADKPLEKGKWDAQTAQVTCPFHKAVFAVAQGGAVVCAPACVPLSVYGVTVENQNVFVELD